MSGEWALRIVIALALSGVLGFEREARRKSAGLRTHILVGLGATLFTLVSLDFPENERARVAAQVVTGVGFLGAGVIFRRGESVKGLTTAANLWVVAAIGVVVGLGRLAEATFATAVAFVVLAVLRAIDEHAQRVAIDSGKEDDDGY